MKLKKFIGSDFYQQSNPIYRQNKRRNGTSYLVPLFFPLPLKMHLFEYTPYHILVSIAKYVGSDLTSLLYINRCWRYSMLTHLHKTCEISINDNDNSPNIKYPLMPYRQISLPTASLVRAVSMSVDANKILNGELTSTTDDMKSLTEFPSANKLRLNILGHVKSKWSLEDISVVSQNIDDFIDLIQRAMPNRTQTSINSMAHTRLFSNEVVCQNLNRLYSQLCPSTLGVVSRNSQLALYPQAVGGISKITYVWDINNHMALPLIYSNSSTLASLSILCKCSMDANNLINQGNRVVVYPQLKALNVSFWKIAEFIASKNPPTNALDVKVNSPFPRLQSLHLDTLNPFKNNLLFCGNEQSLRNLHLTINEHTAQHMVSLGVFRDKKYHQLRNVTVSSTSDSAGNIQLQLALECIEHAQKASLRIPLADQIFFRNMNWDSLKGLQMLEIEYIYLSYSNIIHLVQTIPMLAKLTCCLDGKGIDRWTIDQNKSPSNSFKYCYISNYKNTSTFGIECLERYLKSTCQHFISCRFV